jgi:threonine/homoserine/homoserine lactone efflux protein
MRAAVAYRQGLISNLSNPKMVVFFVSLLPQFSGPDAAFTTVLTLGIVFCLMTLGWLSAYALVVAKSADFLRRGKIRRLLDAATGAVLVALGLRLVTETS